MNEVQFSGGGYYLKRVGDGAGDSGSLLVSHEKTEEGLIPHQGLIKVGCNVECGSPFARTMSAQDYWMTTPVTEIVDVDSEGHWCIFKTGNSEYYCGQMGHYPKRMDDELEERKKAAQEAAEERKKNPVDLFKELDDRF